MQHRAITMIETFVVVAIIGVLAGLTVPLLGTMRETARQVVCTNNLDQMGEATQVYLAENQGVFPEYFFTYTPDNRGKIKVSINPRKSATSGWDIYDDKVVLCSKDVSPSTVPVLKDDNTVAWEPTSYGFNIEVNYREVSYGYIRQPGNLALFYDGVMGKSDTMKEDGAGKVNGNFDDAYDYVTQTFRPRHPAGPGVGIVMFADWHAEPVEALRSDQVLLFPDDESGNGNSGGNGNGNNGNSGNNNGKK